MPIHDYFSDDEKQAAIAAVRREIDATGYGGMVPAEFVVKVVNAALGAISEMRSVQDH